MNKELTCQQVSALINFYIEDKLNPRLKEYVNLTYNKGKTEIFTNNCDIFLFFLYYK